MSSRAGSKGLEGRIWPAGRSLVIPALCHRPMVNSMKTSFAQQQSIEYCHNTLS